MTTPTETRAAIKAARVVFAYVDMGDVPPSYIRIAKHEASRFVREAQEAGARWVWITVAGEVATLGRPVQR